MSVVIDGMMQIFICLCLLVGIVMMFLLLATAAVLTYDYIKVRLSD